MSTPRKLGVLFCLLGLVAVCVLAIVLNTTGPFAGLPGIESSLEAEARAVVANDDVVIIADGRALSVQLPQVMQPGFDRDELATRLEAIRGVRSVELLGDPAIGAIGAPDPTAVPAPDPTVVPAPDPTVVPAPDPTVVPAPDPTEEPVAVEPTLDEIVDGLDLSEVTFEPGTSRFTAQDIAVLDNIADHLHGLSGGPVQVQAHTDRGGDPDVNFLLSQNRADAVVAYLIDRGVNGSLLTSRGFGAQVPIADNATEQGRAANQRVVLVVEGN
jgi:outer membrane protein OmpA-like peptidoglycan-associated protein